MPCRIRSDASLSSRILPAGPTPSNAAKRGLQFDCADCEQLVRYAATVGFFSGSASSSPPDGSIARETRIQPRLLAVSPDGTLHAVLTGGNGTVSDGIGTVIEKFVDGVMY